MVKSINVIKISSIVGGDVLIDDSRWKDFTFDGKLTSLIQYSTLSYFFEIADYQVFFQEAARLNSIIDDLLFIIE